ncbi:hypothetical protein NQZ68_033909 [Dissostichus eleginoides]|nr:hypothetical protein NQZ68_033909 [Dissostichus eleginoides]
MSPRSEWRVSDSWRNGLVGRYIDVDVLLDHYRGIQPKPTCGDTEAAVLCIGLLSLVAKEMQKRVFDDAEPFIDHCSLRTALLGPHSQDPSCFATSPPSELDDRKSTTSDPHANTPSSHARYHNLSSPYDVTEPCP